MVRASFTTKLIDEFSDLWSFLCENLDWDPFSPSSP